jgi:hypothetical protein
MDLIDQKGAVVPVPDEQAEAAVRSGQFTFAQGSQVPIKLGGQVSLVPAEEALQKMHSGGANLASQEDVGAQAKLDKYGGAGGEIRTGLEGAARTASLGASDVLARAVGGDELAADMQARREVNPISEGIGEAAGVLAPALLGDEAGLLGGAGSAVEKGVARLLPEEATSLAGRLATKAVTTGARGAAEGGLLGAQSYASEQALSPNPQLDGEQLLAAVGHGALLGGLGGAALGAGGELGREVLGRVAPRLRGMAEDGMFDALQPGKAERAAAEEFGGAKVVGRDVLDAGVGIGDTLKSAATKLESAADAAEAKVGEVLSQADAAGVKGPSVASLYDALKDDLPKFGPEGASTVQDLFTQAKSAGGSLSFADATAARSKISDLLDNLPEGSSKTATYDLGKVQGALDDLLGQSVKEASKTVGSTFADDLAKAQLTAKRLSFAADTARASLAKAAEKAGGNGIGLGTLGLISHGPLGAATGLAASLAKKFVAERAPLAAAAVMDRVAALGAVQKAVGVVERQTARGIARALGNSAIARVVPKERMGGSFEERRDMITEAAANMPAHQGDIAASVAPFAQHSPQVAAAYVQAASTATAYLAAQLPKPPPGDPTPMVSPKLAKFDPPASEKARWDRQFHAVNDPVGTLAHVEAGTSTPDEVAAVKATHPVWHAKTVTDITAGLADLNEPLPRARMQALSLWCGKALTPTMEPNFIFAMQQRHATAAQPGPKRSGHAPATKTQKADSGKNQERVAERTGLDGLSKGDNA